MRQLNIDEPVEDTVEGYPIDFWQSILTQQILNVAVTKRHFCGLKKVENLDTGGRDTCTRCAYGRLNG